MSPFSSLRFTASPGTSIGQYCNAAGFGSLTNSQSPKWISHDLDNRSNQLNPDNDACRDSRGEDGRPDEWQDRLSGSDNGEKCRIRASPTLPSMAAAVPANQCGDRPLQPCSRPYARARVHKMAGIAVLTARIAASKAVPCTSAQIAAGQYDVDRICLHSAYTKTAIERAKD